MCFVLISEQTAIIYLYSINCLVFITKMECVYCAVRTGYSIHYSGKFQASKARYTAQAVIRHCLTAFIWVQPVVGPCEICAGQSGTGTDNFPIASVSIKPALLHALLYLIATISEGQGGVAWEPLNRGMIFLLVRILERSASALFIVRLQKLVTAFLVVHAECCVCYKLLLALRRLNPIRTEATFAALTLKPSSLSVNKV